MNTKYILIEIQTNADGTVGNLVTAYDDVYSAESAYHSVLASAAVSKLPMHAATLLGNDGGVMKWESYTHGEEE